MHISVKYLKYLFESKGITAEIYNNQIFTAVEQGLIKDVTDKKVLMQQYQVVGATIEFPDGDRYRLNIFNPPDLMNPNNRYNYKVSVEKVKVRV